MDIQLKRGLLDVCVFGEKKLEQMKPYIKVE